MNTFTHLTLATLCLLYYIVMILTCVVFSFLLRKVGLDTNVNDDVEKLHVVIATFAILLSTYLVNKFTLFETRLCLVLFCCSNYLILSSLYFFLCVTLRWSWQRQTLFVFAEFCILLLNNFAFSTTAQWLVIASTDRDIQNDNKPLYICTHLFVFYSILLCTSLNVVPTIMPSSFLFVLILCVFVQMLLCINTCYYKKNTVKFSSLEIEMDVICPQRNATSRVSRFVSNILPIFLAHIALSLLLCILVFLAKASNTLCDDASTPQKIIIYTMSMLFTLFTLPFDECFVSTTIVALLFFIVCNFEHHTCDGIHTALLYVTWSLTWLFDYIQTSNFQEKNCLSNAKHYTLPVSVSCTCILILVL